MTDSSEKAVISSNSCAECSRLRDALEFMYAKWEDGDPCTDGGEPDGASMGNAFKLNEREEKWILSLIPKFPTNPQPPTIETRVLPELTSEQCQRVANALEERSWSGLAHSVIREFDAAIQYARAVTAQKASEGRS